MTICDLETLRPLELIRHYILEKRGRGLCLPYSDNLLISRWLQLANENADLLLLVLSELMPDSISKAKQNGHPLPLKVLDRKVCERILAYENNVSAEPLTARS